MCVLTGWGLGAWGHLGLSAEGAGRGGLPRFLEETWGQDSSSQRDHDRSAGLGL